MKRTLIVCAALAAAGLGGCGGNFEVATAMVDGQPAFEVRRDRTLLPSKVRCIQGLSVWPVEPPAERIDEASVVLMKHMPPAAWSWSVPETNNPCPASLPIVYGRAPKGANVEKVAEPLKIGQVYSVGVAGAEFGSGEGWFRLVSANRVESLRPPSP